MLYPDTTFLPEDRDIDGLYAIQAGNVHIFPFTVPFMGEQVITLKHAFPNSQDWSIRAWFSKKPLDETLFEGIDDWDTFTLNRSDHVFSIWSEGSGMENVKELDPTQTYYLNILNLQNRPNGYIATFSV